MQRLSVGLSLALVAALALPTPGSAGTPAENPYQAEFDFALGRAIELRVDVLGVSLDTITVTARGEVSPGSPAKCDVQFTGSNAGDSSCRAYSRKKCTLESPEIVDTIAVLPRPLNFAMRSTVSRQIRSPNGT